MKYIRFGFENAKLFSTDRNTKDLIIDYSINRIKPGAIMNANTRSIETDHNFIEPITSVQIANVLQVIFGERPSPSKRETVIPKIEHYQKMAAGSYLRIDTLKRYNKSKDKDEFFTEFIQTTKIPGLKKDSTRKDVLLNWHLVEKRCNRYGPDEFSWLVSELTRILNINPLVLYFIDAVQKAKESGDSFFDRDGVLQKRMSALYYAFNGIFNEVTVVKDYMFLVNLRGIDTVPVLFGEFLVPVENEDLDKLKNYGRSTATILDGGLVWLKEVLDPNEMSANSLDEFLLIGELSKEYAN